MLREPGYEEAQASHMKSQMKVCLAVSCSTPVRTSLRDVSEEAFTYPRPSHFLTVIQLKTPNVNRFH